MSTVQRGRGKRKPLRRARWGRGRFLRTIFCLGRKHVTCGLAAHRPGRAAAVAAARRRRCRRGAAFPPGTWAAAAGAWPSRPRRRWPRTAGSGAARAQAPCARSPDRIVNLVKPLKTLKL